MSLMIKGIDLPIEGGYKDIRIYPSGNVDLRLLNEHIQTDCKAIQIPEDHGRIIDAKILKDTIKDSIPTYTAGVKIPTYGDLDLMDKIDKMPTILEAEENA